MIRPRPLACLDGNIGAKEVPEIAFTELLQSLKKAKVNSRRKKNPVGKAVGSAHRHATTSTNMPQDTKSIQKLFPNKTSFENWFECAGQHDTWAEGTALQALSEKPGRPVVVWEKETDGPNVVYARLVVAPRFSHGFARGAKRR